MEHTVPMKIRKGMHTASPKTDTKQRLQDHRPVGPKWSPNKGHAGRPTRIDRSVENKKRMEIRTTRIGGKAKNPEADSHNK
eukprot:15053611-Heterocapsa_arctica.AAC.1